jgi:hypothetical protein
MRDAIRTRFCRWSGVAARRPSSRCLRRSDACSAYPLRSRADAAEWLDSLRGIASLLDAEVLFVSRPSGEGVA